MKYITIEEFCNHHGVEAQLIREFADFGLVHLQTEQDQEVLVGSEINRVERMLRLAQDLDLNPEGIDIILNMRQELLRLRRRTQRLQNRLRQLEQERRWLLLEGPQQQGFIVDLSG